jgi:RimJ/RimL family protein N-acetyltransferase
MDVLAETWPPFGLRLRCGPLELRLPRDEELVALGNLAAAGVHPPEQMPFYSPWTRSQPPALQREFLRFYWGKRAAFAPESWDLLFGVWRDGELVGTQSVGAERFAVRRVVDTGSWVALGRQGRGTGTLMRQAVLALAFEHLGAAEARSSAFEDNPASLAVSRKVGYRDLGWRVLDREGAAVRERVLVLTAEAWRAAERPAVQVAGLAACLPLLGAALPSDTG